MATTAPAGEVSVGAPAPDVYGVPAAGAEPEAQGPVVGSMQPALMLPSPAPSGAAGRHRARLEVHGEDCVSYDGGHGASMATDCSPPVAGDGMSPSMRRQATGTSAGIYVQSGGKSARWSAVAPHRAQRLYGQRGASVPTGFATSASKTARPATAATPAVHRAFASIAALEAATWDAEAPALLASGSAEDQEIFATLTAGERTRLSNFVIFFAAQGLLLGLSCVAAVASQLPEPKLAQALAMLEPALTGLTLVFAEIALVGCVLRALSTQERAAAALSEAATGADAGDERELRRQAWAQATLSIACALANAGELLCCLLSATDGKIYGLAAWPVDDRPTWQGGGARLLLALRAAFGIVAMAIAMLDMQYVVSPSLNAALLQQMLQGGVLGPPAPAKA